MVPHQDTPSVHIVVLTGLALRFILTPLSPNVT